jgi:hypothetical protein
MAHYGLGDLNLTSGTYDLMMRHFGPRSRGLHAQAFNGLGLALIQDGRATGARGAPARARTVPSEPALSKNAALASWSWGMRRKSYASLALAQSPGYAFALGLGRARAQARQSHRRSIRLERVRRIESEAQRRRARGGEPGSRRRRHARRGIGRPVALKRRCARPRLAFGRIGVAWPASADR